MLGGDVLKQKLIEAAIRQYALYGYDGATMRRIADDVGIKPASIYSFYNNKEALFIAAFQQLLQNHFQEMQRILLENKDRSVEEIFSAMLHGLVSHHTGDKQGTIAYISLVTSPVPEIKKYLQQHLRHHNDWLMNSLGDAMKASYPAITDKEVDKTIKQYVLIANGVFWGINLYDGGDFTEQVELADEMIHTLFLELENKR